MSKIFITLDYELFFGNNAGTQYNSIIYPTERLLKILDKNKVKASFFVDSGYLLKLKEYKNEFPTLEADYEEISGQLRKLSIEGHDLQLHIHPHWEDSYYNGEKWIMDTSRYRLNSFSAEEIGSIVFRHKKVLEDFAQNEVFVFRAGGWCIQPFDKIKEALKTNNIWLDSTVFEKGRNKSETHFFDFRKAPSKSIWKFDDNPVQENAEGYFTELPISSIRVTPYFFWKLAYTKMFGGKKYSGFGDGTAAGGSKWDKIRMLTQSSNTVISIDGYKASLLKKAFKKFKKTDEEQNFVIIGHPKALSEFSLKKLEQFFNDSKENVFLTYSSWVKYKIKAN
jgi:peptidoglycan/xylan/chitin deacetylase (PgdA/CDA1 family)